MQVEGGTTALQKADGVKVAGETDGRIIRAANILTELGRDDPMLTFVGAQVEKFRPSLFEVIASSGGGLINGVEFTTNGAAKTVKQAKRNARKGIGMWSTSVTTS